MRKRSSQAGHSGSVSKPKRKRSKSRRQSAKVEESAGTRDAILDATERIMVEEGYAAVSGRRVESEAGLKSQLLHYYFPTMDDLFIAVFQRLEERFYQRFAGAVALEHPIRELWNLNMEAASAKLFYEFKALATHRKAIRTLIVGSTRRDRTMQVAACRLVMARLAINADDPSPTVLALLMASLARTLVTENALGVTDGHAEALAFVERQLQRLESPPLAHPVSGELTPLEAQTSERVTTAASQASTKRAKSS